MTNPPQGKSHLPFFPQPLEWMTSMSHPQCSPTKSAKSHPPYTESQPQKKSAHLHWGTYHPPSGTSSLDNPPLTDSVPADNLPHNSARVTDAPSPTFNLGVNDDSTTLEDGTELPEIREESNLSIYSHHTDPWKKEQISIIAPIAHKDVKFCGNIVLAQKAHTTKGLSYNELKLLINDECTKHGFPHKFDLLERTTTPTQAAIPPQQTKWRICQSFKALNDITTISPMPQGDIRAKQQVLAGHHWITIFDFASGFYACPIAEEDQPYICFYVAERGYYKYLHMLFGLMGAPSHFADITAMALSDLIGILCQLFVDDGSIAGDIFADKMKALRTLLLQIRTTGLSLSAAKTQFFMTSAKFAGKTIGPNRINTDSSKISAIINWETPTTMKGASLAVMNRI
ncbi:hypothetical protein EW146_g10064 [Bondarzewia mesenterica]|uniref:Reverse transcriptase domain-containing protein n=1 Tax=Bondarzewia mesenterica TaxID=1095465 RepID=A0A4S4L0Y8_9AGAM|nr:hypothetical protein EW146_g10064 [Bondarzewia mesenterica]